MEIIDAHCHYWEPNRPDRPYDPEGRELGPPFSNEELLSAAQAAGVTRNVQVTPSIMGYDNTYAFECAEKYPDRIAGVFIRFDTHEPGMVSRLARYRSHPKFWGVRLTLHMAGGHSELADGSLDPFLTEAGKTGVPVALRSIQPQELLVAAKRFPQTTLLLDHMGLRRGKDPYAHWSEILDLVQVPNLYVKVSYWTEIARTPWPFADSQERFREMFERFGPDRLIWGSDVPPSLEGVTYKQNVDFTLHECGFLSESDKAKIFAGTLKSVIAKSGLVGAASA